MRVLLSWLKDFVNLEISAQELAQKLIMSGTEVSGIEDYQTDKVFEIEILPNRADCLSIRGIAREAAAVLNSKFLPRPASPAGRRPAGKIQKIKDSIQVIVKDKKLCPRYMARVIKGVKISPSPDWLKFRLEACGIRSLNNVVDVTNYVLLEIGQPLHAFDLAKISGQKISVRRAENESVLTIDGAERKLDPQTLCLADEKRVVALAGVMGALNTEVTDLTTEILLESAYFDPQSINQTSKRLKIRSESSLRFERGVDWQGVEAALEKAAALIKELAGGEILKGRIDIKSQTRRPKTVKLRLLELKRILGIEIPLKKVKAILSNLGFKVTGAGQILNLKVPTFRAGDIEREIDVIEEIIRIYGYAKIPAVFPQIQPEEEIYSPKEKLEKTARRVLSGAGLSEVLTFSLVDPKNYPNAVPLSNPLSRENSVLRNSLLPGLLLVLEHNLNRQVYSVKIFEIGRVFLKNGKDLPLEKNILFGLLSGKALVPFWDTTETISLDYPAVKGLIEILEVELGLEFTYRQADNPSLHPGKSARILNQGQAVGYLGALHPQLAGNFNLDQDVYVFEIDLDQILLQPPDLKKFQSLPRYPAVRRDIALIISDNLTHAQIIELIKKTGGSLIEDVFLFDRFTGRQIGENKVSLAYGIIYRDKSKTLSSEEVHQLHQKVAAALRREFNLEIR